MLLKNHYFWADGLADSKYLQLDCFFNIRQTRNIWCVDTEHRDISAHSSFLFGSGDVQQWSIAE